LAFFLGAEDDDKPLGSLSFLGFFFQMQNMTTNWEALGLSSSLGFLSQVQKMTMSWEAHHRLLIFLL
jgi:hypothetical protein